MWIMRTTATYAVGHLVNTARTIDLCQIACKLFAGCDGIDWSPTKPEGQRCYFTGPWVTSWKTGTAADGYVHFDYSFVAGQNVVPDVVMLRTGCFVMKTPVAYL